MNLFDLYATISLNTKDYERGIDAASRKSGTLSKSLETTTNKIKTLKARQQEARKEVERLTDAYNKSAKETGADSKETQELANKLKEAENNVESITKEIDDYNESLKKGGSYSEAFGKIGEIGRKVFDAIKVAAAVGGAAVTAFAKSAIDTGMEFDASMSKVKAISGATGEGFTSLREKALEMGAKTKFSATESAEAMNYMAMAGWKTEDMLNGIEGVMNLAAASGEDLATTSDIVTDAMTAFGMSADQSSHFADVLAASAANSNTNVGMLGDSFKYVAPVACSLGYNVEDVAVALGLMANSGIKASQGGTALRNVLTNMSNPTKNMQVAMDALGVSLTDENGNMLSLMEIMRELRTSFNDGSLETHEFEKSQTLLQSQLKNGEITQEEYDEQVNKLAESVFNAAGAHKAQYAAMLAGKYGMAGLLAIVGSTDEDFENLTNSIYNCNGAAEDMANTMLDNLSGDVTIFQSALNDLRIHLYDKFEPALRDMTQKATDFIKSIDVDAAVESIKDLGDQFMKLLPLITGAVGAMMAYKAASAISGVIDALKKATESQTIAQAALNAVMNANPFVLIATLIAGVVTALVTLALTSEDFREKIKKVWDAISHPIETIKNVWNDAKTFLSNKWQEIKNAASEKWQGIKDTISNAVENTKSKLSTAWENIKSNLSTKWENIKSTASTKWAGIRDAISSATENTRSKLSTAWDNIRGNLGSVWDRIKNSSSTKWNEITNGIQNIFGNLPDKIREIGRNILTGLWNGIKEKWQNFKDKCSGIVDNIKGLFSGKSGFDSHSPSRWAETLFENLLEGGEVGLDNAKGALFRNVGGIVDDVKNMMGLDAISGNAGYGVSTIGTSNMGTSSDSSDTETVTEYNMQVTINLNGSDYTSQRQIAEEISVQLQNLVNRRSAAWA